MLERPLLCGRDNVEPDLCQPAPKPFRVFCPRCSADSDAEGKVFAVGSPVLAPHANFLLMELHCNTCQKEFDIGLWPIDPERFAQKENEAGELGGYETPDTMVILNRYLRMIEVSRRKWEIAYRRKAEGAAGRLGMHYPRAYVDPSETRLTAIPARCLAVARGLRKVVAAHPGQDPVGLLQVGAFQCLLSLEETPNASAPYCLHLSVSDSSLERIPAAQEAWLQERGLVVSPLFFAPTEGDLRTPTPMETGLLACLFFTPAERPFLTSEAGQSLPVAHIRLGLQTPDLGD
jgi:hypothetical protein